MKSQGLFITLEGIDGVGKSTQLRLLASTLRERGCRVCVSREPGGTHIGEQIRRVLLASRNTQLAALSELALMYAARAQHLHEVVRPALARGEIVLSDRFNDASFAYQGYGRRLGAAAVRALDQIICGDTQPDLTLLLDMTPHVALQRATTRENQIKSRYRRFEGAGLNFQERVREGYLAIARRNPKRVMVVNADRSIEEVQDEIRRIVDRFLRRRRGARKGEWHPAKGPM
ncbi:MAG TPA: dTMP kinase [Terriglobia bacterium]|nr:dTMP kinase [Terriglobia bacterium]